MFSIIFQNNASKKITVYDGLFSSGNDLYLLFEDFVFSQGEEDGFYTYYLFYNDRDDVTYIFNEVPLKTIIKTQDGEVTLYDLNPLTGLMRLGNMVENTNFRKNNKKNEYLYR